LSCLAKKWRNVLTSWSQKLRKREETKREILYMKRLNLLLLLCYIPDSFLVLRICTHRQSIRRLEWLQNGNSVFFKHFFLLFFSFIFKMDFWHLNAHSLSSDFIIQKIRPSFYLFKWCQTVCDKLFKVPQSMSLSPNKQLLLGNFEYLGH
jgi:hypothetical protein